MNNPLFNEFAARFAASFLPSLIESFNRQVGQRGFNSARVAYDYALIEELIRRGIDTSAVFDGRSVSFAHRVVLEDNRLVIEK